MSHFSVHSLETAPEASRSYLATAQKNSGYIPNLLGVLAHAPVALETYVTVSGINSRSSLTAPEREVVQLIAATTHGCTFCVAGHTVVAGKVKLPADVIAALREEKPLPDVRLEALAAFSREVIRTRGRVESPELEAFLAAGFTEAQALETVLGISLATLCNFANNLARTPLNPELATWKWEPLNA